MRISRGLVALACVGLFSGGGLWAAEKYHAKLFTRGGPNTESVLRLEINVDGYTTGEEGWLMFHALNYEGWEPFIAAFRQANKGKIIFHGARGLNITVHAARVIPREDGGRQIMLFTEKQTWEVDVQQRTDARFPFMVFELDVDNKGNGEGKIYENAQIRLQGNRDTGTGAVEMESYNSAPKVLFGVTLAK